MPSRRMLVLASAAHAAHVAAGANPIRKIVKMLQATVANVEAEGKAQEELYNKFICYCKNGKGSLEKAIADAEDKAPKVSNAIERTEAELKQLKGDLESAKAERIEAQTAVKEAKALRAKELGIFEKTSGDFKTNIAAMGKAITALEAGASGGSFLQSSLVSLLKKLSNSLELRPIDRETFSAFLSSDHTYAPQSGEITGILKQMKETMEGDLAEAEGKEAKAIEQFEGMVAAKEKLIREIGAIVEKKTQRLGDAGVELVELKADLSDTQEQLLDDKKFLEEMDKNCATKADEWAATCKVRSDEILALHETIKILNDDDALELFKKTLPSASLIQMKSAQKLYFNRAARTLKNSHHVSTDLVALALQGKKVSMGKVVEMIDNMVKLLGQEQSDDEAKKGFCEKQIKETETEIKELEWHIEDVGKEIEKAKASAASLASEIKALTGGIAELDEQVATATEQRKKENAQFVSDSAENRATVELLGVAKNRMNKFYNPSLYKETKRELTKEDRVAVNLGLGTPPPTEATGIAGTGVTVLAQADPGPAPGIGKYEKKSEESGGILALIGRLIADVKTEMVENETEEKNAQAAYEQLSKDAAAKRASDVQSVKDKTAAKAEAEARLLKYTEESASTKKAVVGKVASLGGVHQDCDWLLQNFDTRVAARADEVKSLKNAKAVLAGADYSFL